MKFAQEKAIVQMPIFLCVKSPSRHQRQQPWRSSYTALVGGSVTGFRSWEEIMAAYLCEPAIFISFKCALIVRERAWLDYLLSYS